MSRNLFEYLLTNPSIINWKKEINDVIYGNRYYLLQNISVEGYFKQIVASIDKSMRSEMVSNRDLAIDQFFSKWDSKLKINTSKDSYYYEKVLELAKFYRPLMGELKLIEFIESCPLYNSENFKDKKEVYEIYLKGIRALSSYFPKTSEISDTRIDTGLLGRLILFLEQELKSPNKGFKLFTIQRILKHGFVNTSIEQLRRILINDLPLMERLIRSIVKNKTLNFREESLILDLFQNESEWLISNLNHLKIEINFSSKELKVLDNQFKLSSKALRLVEMTPEKQRILNNIQIQKVEELQTSIEEIIDGKNDN